MQRKYDALIACEEFGEVRDAYINKGRKAISCDLNQTRKRGPHHAGDLEHFITRYKWRTIIAFPPCTYLCSSGLHWNNRTPGRTKLTEQGLRFVCIILNQPVPELALENPVGCISTRIAIVNGIYRVMPLGSKDNYPRITPSQTIQPYNFGHDASKATCLYLRNLPELTPTSYIPPRYVWHNNKWVERWGNQTDSGQNKLGPSEDRAALRGKTYSGIAQAMADQWAV